MKKSLLITLILLTNFVNAQTFTKYVDNSQSNGIGFSYNVTFRLTLLRMASESTLKSAANGTEYSVELVRVEIDKNKGWYLSGKTYNCEQLEGICNTKNFSSINLGLEYNCSGKEIGTNTATFYNIGDKQTMDLQPKSVGGTSCKSPTVSGICWLKVNNNETVTKVALIIQKLNNSNSNTSLGNKTNNPTTQTNTTGVPANTSTQTSIEQIPDNYKGNPMTYNTPSAYSNDKTVEAIGQFSNAITPMLNEWGANLQRRREAQEQREMEVANKKKLTIENYFRSQLNLYLDAANKGDENARMKLVSLHSYNRSDGHDFTYLLPDLNSWIEVAAKNKNLDAMCFVGRFIYAEESYFKNSSPYYGIKSKDDVIKILEEAANLGSLDAMAYLGNYYNLKKKFRGGADADKALYWFAKAGENGCPDALYNMGMIHRYGTSDAFYYVKHKMNKNDTLAFNFFLKSVSNPNFAESLFQAADTRGCKFTNSSYKELSLMYEKGIGCEKNKDIAKKLYEEYMK